MNSIADLIEEYDLPIVEINPDRQYWLVRTFAGEHYEEFFHDDFIAISWNEFSDIERFKKVEKSVLVKEIENTYPDEKRPGHIYGQMDRFIRQISVGDVVMIPSKNSTHISFGLIASDVYVRELSESAIDQEICTFKKARDVKWLKTIKRDDLDPYLYKLMQSHQTVNSANDYSDVIDRTLHSFYIKDNTAHFVLDVRQTKDIPAMDLVTSINSLIELVPDIQDPFDQEKSFKKEDVDLKLRVQSPGIMEFIASGNLIWGVLGMGILVLFITGGKAKFSKTKEKIEGELETEGLLEKILKFKKERNNQDLKLREHEQNVKKAFEKLDAKVPDDLQSTKNE